MGSNNRCYDFLVIGAGPVGSYLASRLAASGYSVLVLERRAKLGGPVCCTGLVGKECVERFDLPPELIIRKVYGAHIYSPSGRLVKLERPEVQAVVVDRGALDLEMARRGVESGAKYRLGNLVQDIDITPEGVMARVDNHGVSGTVEGRYAVIATGFRPRLLRRIGLGGRRDFAVGAQAEVCSSVQDIEVYTGRNVAPGFFAWLVPTRPGRALLGLLSHNRPRYYLKGLAARLADEGKIDSSPRLILSRGVSLQAAPRASLKKIMVVGDAAGQVKPVTGGGIFFGLIGADAAAEAIARSHDNPERGISLYERQWRKRLGRELRIGHIARVVYERLSDSKLDSIFSTINSNGLVEDLIQSQHVEFDWHGRALGYLFKRNPCSWLRLLQPTRGTKKYDL